MDDQASARQPEQTASTDHVDVKILFVHGIGEQKKSDTLTESAEALREW
jgi:hypothetical protein